MCLKHRAMLSVCLPSLAYRVVSPWHVARKLEGANDDEADRVRRFNETRHRKPEEKEGVLRGARKNGRQGADAETGGRGGKREEGEVDDDGDLEARSERVVERSASRRAVSKTGRGGGRRHRSCCP